MNIANPSIFPLRRTPACGSRLLHTALAVQFGASATRQVRTHLPSSTSPRQQERAGGSTSRTFPRSRVVGLFVSCDPGEHHRASLFVIHQAIDGRCDLLYQSNLLFFDQLSQLDRQTQSTYRETAWSTPFRVWRLLRRRGRVHVDGTGWSRLLQLLAPQRLPLTDSCLNHRFHHRLLPTARRQAQITKELMVPFFGPFTETTGRCGPRLAQRACLPLPPSS